MARHFEVEVQDARRIDYFLTRVGAPHLMLRLHQVRDTLHVPRQSLAQMCLSAIRKLENPSKYRVDI